MMRKRASALMLVVAVAIGLAACKPKEKPPAPPQPAPTGLDQGWSAADQKAWYEATQGSRLIPMAWADALETADTETKFFSPANMTRFGYLPPMPDATRQLPIGFVADDSDDTDLKRTKLRWFGEQTSREPWIGMTCAACHTAELTYQGKTLRVDGGPALADYQGFVEGFVAALRATKSDALKWERFNVAVLAGRDTPANRALLKTAYDRVLTWENKSLALNATPLRYGFGRLDAVGHILNRVGQIADDDPFANPSDAPVSYPFIWNTAQSDLIQWNGMTENKPLTGPGGAFDYGALGRNVGEVTGVFGDVVLTKKAGLAGYRSSAQVVNLERLEQTLSRLRPPAWPSEVLGAPDIALVDEGRPLFVQRCATCHTPLARTDLTTRFTARMSHFNSTDPKNPPPGTDIWMACNAYTNLANAGILEGTIRRDDSRAAIGRVEPAVNLLGATVTGTILGKKAELAEAALTTWLGVKPPPRIAIASVDERAEREVRRQRCMTETHRTLGYKARPLMGVWATAPYLHNGSVATLHDLLLPEADRPRSFAVGGREYDPANVGYAAGQTGPNSFTFVTHDADKPRDGNSNAGHDYGNASLTAQQRRALVEYLKTL